MVRRAFVEASPESGLAGGGAIHHPILPEVNRILTLLREFRGRKIRALSGQSSSNTAVGYRIVRYQRESVMIREDVPGSVWANVVAILSVAGAMSALFIPLLLKRRGAVSTSALPIAIEPEPYRRACVSRIAEPAK
jgi:hypothetical protein